MFRPGSTNTHVVATVHSDASLAAARTLRAGDVDFIELRVDAFAQDPEPLLHAAAELPAPLIVTVRHPMEGGTAAALTVEKRRELFEKFLHCAAVVDVELRSAMELSQVLENARASGTKILLSHHDFQKTPAREQLAALAQQAREAGADIFKVAAVASEASDLATLLDFLICEKNGLALSVMAMGAFGKISRLLFAQTGSVLNYGFLDQANASGQWPARLLKERIAELKA
jgi:3-dehydroquinate dehydratase-1